MILRPCTPKFIWNPWKGPTNPFSDKPMVRVKWTNEVQATRAERRHVWECNKPWNVAMFRRYMNVSDLQMDRCGSFSLHNSSCHVIFTSFASFFLRTHRWFDVFWWILVVQELPHVYIMRSCGKKGSLCDRCGTLVGNIPMRSPSFSQRKSWFKAHEIPYDCSPFA